MDPQQLETKMANVDIDAMWPEEARSFFAEMEKGLRKYFPGYIVMCGVLLPEKVKRPGDSMSAFPCRSLIHGPTEMRVALLASLIVHRPEMVAQALDIAGQILRAGELDK
jgi:hypothetical protein